MEGNSHRQDQVLIPDDLAEAFQPVIGAPVTLRPLHPEDVDIEGAFLSGLSHETRHNRLLGGAIAITRAYLERLTRVNYERDMALAATVFLGEEEQLIGVARYVLESDDAACEFAIVVADAWQRRGIGSRLLAKLVAVARQRRVPRMYGDILSINRGMLELVKRHGFMLGRHPEDPTLTRATLAL